MEQKNIWNKYDAETLEKVNVLSDEYRSFLDQGKTERECIDETVEMIENAGYISLQKAIEEGRSLSVGDKVYYVHMNKSIAMFQIGTKPMTEGMNILGAHIDSPRVDVKQNPLYEDREFAYLDTHYYGGIKKYQWVAMPLAIHGVVVKKDMTTVIVNIGEDEDDPVFFISDILIHLAQEQMKKTAGQVINGEAMDLIVGSRPLKIEASEDVDGAENASGKDSEKENKGPERDAVKKAVLEILKQQYDIEEEDFLSAELEIVPAGKAREAGFDRSMILGYGQDDRVCAFTSLKAMLDLGITEKTVCCLLVDKEEIGSVGATGMKSLFFENAVAELLELCGGYSDLALRRCLQRSCMLSSDVSAAFDPLYASCFETKNAAFFGHGIVLNKFTGRGGKSGSNDANAEYVAHLRSIFEKEDVSFQTAELGKVDVGGGGTIAYVLATYGMNVIDSGVPVLSMHAPWEATSKIDIYEAYRGYIAFASDADLY
ncbi:MAG: aminopeptidase [Lachnospiraceae bacterium]|nr:aminopeptidase [Lachnospiraceae bacterium]